ncbi:MAG: metallophosphoesterase [Succiniclasticum sp.]|jgi:predicted MPP superfamily phosphohydrolase
MNRFFYMVTGVGLFLTFFYWLMYRTGVPLFRHNASQFILLLPLAFGWLQMYGADSALPMPVLRVIAYIGGYWLAFFHYSLYVLLLYILLRVGLFAVNAFQPGLVDASVFLSRYLCVALFLVLLLVVAGGWNALHPRVRTVEFDTHGRLAKPQTVVFVTDMHLGSLFGRSYAEELTTTINAQQPDVVLVGGDLVDNRLLWVRRERSYEPLKDIHSVYGVYAVRGNHDHLDGRIGEEEMLFRSIGFRFLVNEAVDLPDGLHLVGLEDYRSQPVNPYLASLAGTNPQQVQILVEHQPRRFLEARDAGYDLYLAGHTHAGQQAPLNLITRRMYLLDNGSRYFGPMLGVVSSGYGLWGSPVRIGNRPEIVVLKLR